VELSLSSNQNLDDLGIVNYRFLINIGVNYQNRYDECDEDPTYSSHSENYVREGYSYFRPINLLPSSYSEEEGGVQGCNIGYIKYTNKVVGINIDAVVTVYNQNGESYQIPVSVE
jgi:hypothetical protein